MVAHDKEVLMQLSKEHLIYLIEQMQHSLGMIGETCVSESKLHIDSKEAIKKIRGYIYDTPSLCDGAATVAAYIDMKLGKLSVNDYRRIILGS